MELTRIISIHYEVKPPRLCTVKLAYICPDTGKSPGGSFTVRYDMISFTVILMLFSYLVMGVIHLLALLCFPSSSVLDEDNSCRGLAQFFIRLTELQNIWCQIDECVSSCLAAVYPAAPFA